MINIEEVISMQAAEIYERMVWTGAFNLTVITAARGTEIALNCAEAGFHTIRVRETEFLYDDLEKLVEKSFLRREGACYYLTRQRAEEFLAGKEKEADAEELD